MDDEARQRLREEWTGQRVTIASTSSRLARFAGKTGVVKTINQNGRALVQFAGTEDIGWYDIDPVELRLITESTL